MDEDEKTNMERLAMFFAAVADNPTRFPVTGRMAKGLKQGRRLARGPAQPQSRRNKRKARQEARQGGHKRRRREHREFVENFNRAQAITERDMAEAQEIQEQRQAEIALEPKFNVTDIMGNVLLEGVPESMIVAQVDQEWVERAQAEADEYRGLVESGEIQTSPPKVIMPGSAEALGLEGE